MNKNTLKIGLSVLVIVILIGGALFYKFSTVSAPQDEQETTQSENTENLPDQGDGVLVPNIEIETNEPGIIICADLCGDGICQDKIATCKGGSLNCSCQESRQECPQDCK